jgi:UDP:flavonoid glycosyltransferase YjiC (YdhE family)
MLVSVALRDHIEPLRYLGAELLGRGYAVSLAIPEEAREWLLADGLGFNLVVTGNTATAMRERPVNLTVDPTLRRISNGACR